MGPTVTARRQPWPTTASRSRHHDPGRRAGTAAPHPRSNARDVPSTPPTSHRSPPPTQHRCDAGRASADPDDQRPHGRRRSPNLTGCWSVLDRTGETASDARPPLAGNSRPSRPNSACSAMCALTIGSRCGGIATSRVPASLFGVPTTALPSTWTTARRISDPAVLHDRGRSGVARSAHRTADHTRRRAAPSAGAAPACWRPGPRARARSAA